ncbi:MAG: PIG-L deacetylase family protein [Promethearchaeota archaeon]
MVLAPHPDDEVLGCGGIILEAIKKALPLQVVFFTYGDSNEWSFVRYRKRPVLLPRQIKRMGLIRYEEAIRAAQILGLSNDQLIFLGYPDFGTLNIWYFHWRQRPALKSMLTRARAVPYKNAFRPGAPYKGEEILKDLKTIIIKFQPTKIFLSHRHDFNTDHQALYLFTRIVLWSLEKELKPELYPYLIHFDKWPYPRAYFPDKALNAPKTLKEKIKWKSVPLSDVEIETKFKALEAHQTQLRSNKKYLLSFIRSNELFGDYEIIKAKDIVSETQIEEGAIYSVIPFEELSEAEKSVFVGIRAHSISLKDENLVLKVNISGFASERVRRMDKKVKREIRKIGDTILPESIEKIAQGSIEGFLPTIKEGIVPISIASSLPKNVGVSFYIFGYRYDQPFEDMPKLWIRVGRKGYNLFDLEKQLSEPIEVVREESELTVIVSLKLLKNPDKILINVRNNVESHTLDWISWRIIELK